MQTAAHMWIFHLLHERPAFRPPRSGPYLGKRFLLILPPLDADLVGARRFARILGQQGIFVAAGIETHGEVHGDTGDILWPNLLLVDAAHHRWDAVVFAGGRGAAERVAEDPLARHFATRAVADGVPVAAWGEGREVLARAGLAGRFYGQAEAVAAGLVEHLRETARVTSERPTPRRAGLRRLVRELLSRSSRRMAQEDGT